MRQDNIIILGADIPVFVIDGDSYASVAGLETLFGWTTTPTKLTVYHEDLDGRNVVHAAFLPNYLYAAASETIPNTAAEELVTNYAKHIDKMIADVYAATTMTADQIQNRQLTKNQITALTNELKDITDRQAGYQERIDKIDIPTESIKKLEQKREAKRRAIEKLDPEMKALIQSGAKDPKHADHAKLLDKTEKLKTLQQEMQEASNKANELNKKIPQVSQEKLSLTNQVKALNPERDQLETKIKVLKSQLESFGPEPSAVTNILSRVFKA